MAEYISLTAAQLAAQAGLLRECAHLLELELRGNDDNGRCSLAFARLTEPDPFALFDVDVGPTAPVMLGTDQRDQLVPLLAENLRTLAPGASVLDVGAGNGMTTAAALAERRDPLRLIPLDPSEAALDAYAARFARQLPQVSIARTMVAGIDEMVTAAPDSALALSEPLDMAIAIHSLYFTADPMRYLRHVHERLVPGGKLVVVFASAADDFSNRMTHGYRESFAARRPAKEHASALALDGLFGLSGQGADREACDAALRAHLGAHALCTIEVIRQPTRLFVHSFRDLLACGFLNGLGADDPARLSHQIEYIASRLLREPEQFDLRLTLSGPRARMLSVAQPQYFIVLQKR